MLGKSLKNLRLFLFAWFLGCFSPVSAYAQVTVAPFLNARVTFLDQNGKPVAAGCVFTFAAGTSTPQATYSDLGVTLNANPVILDSTGSATIYLQMLSYKFQLKTTGGTNCATGSSVFTQDNVNPSTPLSTFAGLVTTAALTMQQPTAATSGANQSSFNFCEQGSYWTGSAAATDQWCWVDTLGTGANPTATYSLTHSGTSGTASVNIPVPVAITAALTTQQANGVFWIGSGTGQYASLTTCNAALPSTGGTCAMTDGFTDPTWTANLVISKPNVTFLIPCTATIPMSTFQVTKAGGINGFSVIEDCIPSQFNTSHLTWQYTGTGNAFQLGDTTTTTWGLQLVNVAISLFSANGASAGGIAIVNTENFFMTFPQIQAASPLGSSTGGCAITLDGTGSANTEGVIWQPQFYFAPFCGIKFTGNGGAGNNASVVQVVGGKFVSGCASGGTGLNFVQGSGNVVTDMDLESCPTGVAFGNSVNVNGNKVSFWNALNTVDCSFGASSKNNECVTFIGEPVVSGAGIALNVIQGNSAYLQGDWFMADGVWNKTGVDGATSYVSQTLVGPSSGGVFTQLTNTNAGYTIAYGADPTGDFSIYDGRFPSSAGNLRATLQHGTGILRTTGNTVRLTSNFTTANNTNLQAISNGAGNQLVWGPVPATAVSYTFSCDIAYSQSVGNAAVAFGIQAATNNPTNIFATGTQQITAGPPATYVSGTLATLATTTATNIVSGTPGATSVNYTVHLGGTIENSANANTFNIMASTATGADFVTVLRGSACQFTP